ncbi:MAG: type IV secretion protein IcmT [Micavibrio aeruginosavorus]|uniref:Type IV secretion protein IcmT n=1 Tax=Micavibrio aeruginosavorus TaxID=349221 RepID=A0A2W5HP32_9BACT|nr:MAG: type IV secretion protein IcmT [Micavibrio aeruginosavorus]
MATNISDVKEQLNWHWRNSMRPIRFFALDARAAMPLCFLLPFPRWSTLILAVSVIIFFVFLEKRGLTFPSAMRSIRGLIFGDRRPALMTFKYRKLKDFG